MRIQEFLLDRVTQDEEAAAASPGYDLGPNHAHVGDRRFDHRRAVIHRHHDEPVNVIVLGVSQSVTKCGICVREAARPCIALRTLAAPDSTHPHFDQAWVLEPVGTPSR